MGLNLKQKNCRNRECRKEFKQHTEWQQYCSAKCRITMRNRRNAKMLKEAKQIVREREEQERQSAAQ